MTDAGNDLEGLVAAANDGDRSALNRVLAIIRPLVVRYCRARIGRHERSSVSADDVAQEVCLAVLTALPRYRDEGRPFAAFVFGIAAHKVADAQRASIRGAVPTDDLPDRLDDARGPEEAAVHEAEVGAMPMQRGATPGPGVNLTEREMQVLRGMSQGKSNGQIGRELYLSEDTIKTHARRLFRKLGVNDRAQAVALGFRRGLVH